MLGKFKKFFNELLTPLIKFFPKKPNLLTILSLVIASFSIPIVLLLPFQYFVLTIPILIIACFLDVIDGLIARKYGLVTKLGSFLDSICDRYVDTIMLLNLALVTKDYLISIIVILSLLGSYMTSYSRAKGESLGLEMIGIGFFERSERIIYLIITYIIYYILNNIQVLMIMLIIFAIITNLTAIERILRISKTIKC